MFQSRNRETYDSNEQDYLMHQSQVALSFNLVIEKLMIPTEISRLCPIPICQFQSRNRETYDSNLANGPVARPYTPSFNLVIEKLMIPTLASISIA